MASFSKKLLSDYVVVDLETTGLSPDTDRITEIAAVKVINNEISDTFSTLINPHIYISPAITDITGIDNDMVRNAPDIQDIMPLFLDFVGELSIVGHNIIRFDMRFLNAVKPVDIFCVDTLDIANHMHTGSCGHSLTALCARFGIINDNAHRALSDCIANHKVYQKMKQFYKNNGAYFTMAVSCGRKMYQANIEQFCRTGAMLDVTHDIKSDSLLLSVNSHPVGVVSGSKKTEYEENTDIITCIKVSKLTINDKGKYLMSAEVTLGGSDLNI